MHLLCLLERYSPKWLDGTKTAKWASIRWKRTQLWASLVAQWLRIHLPMQGTRVRALVQEDPTCRGATKPVRHNYWAWALEPVSHNYWARAPQLLKPMHLEPMLCNKRSHCNEKQTHRTVTKSSPHSPQLQKACVQQRRSNTAKNKLKKKKKKDPAPNTNALTIRSKLSIHLWIPSTNHIKFVWEYCVLRTLKIL